MIFQPKFDWVSDKAICADMINRPHEDYPDRVKATLSCIEVLINIRKDLISSFDAKTIHSIIFAACPFAGRWRDCNVTIGKEIPPDHFLVPELIEKIFPICREKINLIDWYKEFQTIHPFEDGNGRVGGIIVAVLSWDGEKLLAPLQ